jgi:uncharacterized protein YndB with AHSA1/START domain
MTETTLTLHRILKVPRALVWDCWTDPDHLKNWFVPRPHTIEKVEMDVMPGGRFNTLMKVDGNLYPNDGSILAVTPGERLVFTDLMLTGWQPVAEPGLGFTAELILRDHPDGTDYTAIARHRTVEGATTHEAMGFQDGWGTVASQLEDYIQTTLLR